MHIQYADMIDSLFSEIPQWNGGPALVGLAA